MTNREKIIALSKGKRSRLLKDVKDRIDNRKFYKESQNIALRILERLSDLNWSQADLARKLAVNPQQVTKFVSGKANFELKTLLRLQEVLNLPILASNYEKRNAI